MPDFDVRRFAQPTGADLYYQTPLTTIAVAYMQAQDQYIADKVFPNVPVRQQAGLYWTIPRGNWNRPEAKVRAPGTESIGSGWTTATATYRAEVYAFHKDITAPDRANAIAPFDPERESTDFVMRNLLLTREVIFAQQYFGTGIWGTERTGVASGETGTQFRQWNDPNSNPIREIRADATAMALRTGGFRPNRLILGPNVLDTLFDHPSIISRLGYNVRQIVTTDILAQLFDVDQVLVPRVVQNTAIEGAAEANSFVYGKAALLCYAAPTPGLMTPSAGYTFSWNGYLPGTGLGVNVDRFDIPELKVTRVEGEMSFDLKVIAPDLGTFYNAAIA